MTFFFPFFISPVRPFATRPTLSLARSSRLAPVDAFAINRERIPSSPRRRRQSTLTILMTLAFPMRCRATMHSPGLQYPAFLACSMAAVRISSVVSVSVALALPSASSGVSPRVRFACLAGDSPLHVHVSETLNQNRMRLLLLHCR